MRLIAQAVRRQIELDPIAFDALLAGILNCRAYAKQILKPVSDACLKPVQLNTVLRSLLRLRKTLERDRFDHKRLPLIPKFFISSLTLKTGLSEIAYDLTPKVDQLTHWLENAPKEKDTLVITIRGNHELALIAPLPMIHELQKAFPRQKPKGLVTGLAAVTVTYPSADYLFLPGITYALIRQLALHRINMLEKCSTYSEETFFVAEEDAAATFECLKPFLKANTRSA
ncbi:hypothetical protein KBD34_03765 [Patescibacteria group bacterium]|nr:hypothetical protein [Patescibacteria group bacterium]